MQRRFNRVPSKQYTNQDEQAMVERTELIHQHLLAKFKEKNEVDFIFSSSKLECVFPSMNINQIGRSLARLRKMGVVDKDKQPNRWHTTFTFPITITVEDYKRWKILAIVVTVIIIMFLIVRWVVV